MPRLRLWVSGYIQTCLGADLSAVFDVELAAAASAVTTTFPKLSTDTSFVLGSLTIQKHNMPKILQHLLII